METTRSATLCACYCLPLTGRIVGSAGGGILKRLQRNTAHPSGVGGDTFGSFVSMSFSSFFSFSFLIFSSPDPAYGHNVAMDWQKVLVSSALAGGVAYVLYTTYTRPQSTSPVLKVKQSKDEKLRREVRHQ